MTSQMRAWVAAAACVRPGAAELPWTAEVATGAERRSMARVCAGCPALGACSAEVVRDRPTVGFWAGRDLTASEAPEQLALRLGVMARGA